MKIPVSAVAFALSLLLAVPGISRAGSYSQDFSGFSIGTTDLGDGTTIASNDGVASVRGSGDRYLRLTANNTGNTSSSFKLPDLDPGQELESFTFTFDLHIGGSGTFADGVSLTFGGIPAGNGGGEAGFAVDDGLIIAWDTYNNGGDDPSVEVFSDGVSVGNYLHNYGSTSGDWVPVVIHWDANGLDLTYDGSTLATNLATPGFSPSTGDRFAFSGRTGGANQNSYLDDVSVTTVTQSPINTGGPVISEFVADNDDGLEDEDLDRSDWIEIYNGQNASVNLSGYYLTNDFGNRMMWQFPSQPLAAYEYFVLFASGKDRAVAGSTLHTNFTLPKAGGYLALVAPDGVTVLSEFNFGEQSGDVAYGELGHARTLGFLETPTPGEKNLRAPGRRATRGGRRVRPHRRSFLELDHAVDSSDHLAIGRGALHHRRHRADGGLAGLLVDLQHYQYNNGPRPRLRARSAPRRDQEPHAHRTRLGRAEFFLQPADRHRRLRRGEHRPRQQPRGAAPVPPRLHRGHRPRPGRRSRPYDWGYRFHRPRRNARPRAEFVRLPEKAVRLGDLEQRGRGQGRLDPRHAERVRLDPARAVLRQDADAQRHRLRGRPPAVRQRRRRAHALRRTVLQP